MEWGPLEPLVALVVPSRGVNDSDGDRTLTDATLALALNSDELTAAVRAASIAQLDAALRHEVFTVDRLPLTCLLLLSAKASKWEHATHQEEETTQGARMQLLLQISQLLYHLPVTVAMKEMKQISGVVTVYTRLAVEMQQSLKTICPLQRFLRRFYQHGQAVLTPVHAHFLYMCLHAKCYSAAMDILDETLVEIQALAQVVTSVDFLGYAYYGGLLYLGEKRYQDALDFFQLAITAPAVSLSAFVIEAYKKLLLVTLILHGEAVVMPKYTPFVVTRNVENHCTAYVHLANAFVVDKDFAAMQEVVATNEELFVQDSNFGLVKQVVQAFKQRKLLQLTRTYATIELAKIATAAGMSNSDAVAAEKMLLTLISNGQMDAVIDKQKAMVRFVHENEDGGAYQDEVQGEASKRLQDEMKKLVVVASQLRVMDTELVTSVKFQSRLQKDKDRRSRIHMHNQQSDERLTVDTASGMDTLE